jgi:CHAT domain-containing protein/tetratricopeptide (TPR) repeat protein
MGRGSDVSAQVGELNRRVAELYQRGRIGEALRLAEQAVQLAKTALGPQHPDLASSLNNLGFLLRAMGENARALPYYEQALAMDQRLYPEGQYPDGHPHLACSLDNLGFLLRAMGENARALPYHQQALAMYQRLYPEGQYPNGHPDLATSLGNLGGLLQAMGENARALPYYEQALAMRQRLYPEGQYPDGHPHLALSLDNLGFLLQAMGENARALPYCQQALAMRQRLYPEGQYPNGHPDLALSLHDLGALWVALGEPTEAWQCMHRAAPMDDWMIGQVFSIGSDRQRLAFVRTVQGNTDIFLSLVLRHVARDPDLVPERQAEELRRQAIRSALDLVLRRKGLAAEALAAQRDAVLGGRYPQLEPQLRQWTQMRMQIAQKELAGPGREGPAAHQRQLAAWHAQKENLEEELARQIPELNLEERLRQSDRRAVALALEAGACLVEFVRFHEFDFHAAARPWGPARYLAFVLPGKEPDDVQMIDLGPAEDIDRLIADFRAGVAVRPDQRSARRTQPVSQAEQADRPDPGLPLRRAVFDPLTRAFGGRIRLYLCPDGDLARVPFEVLPAAEGGRLLDQYRISYLTTGRDLPRFGAAATGQPAAPLVVGSPDFDLGKKRAWGWLLGAAARLADPAPRDPAPPEPEGDRVRDALRDFRGKYRFEELEGMRREARTVSQMFGVRAWLDGEALEGRLKQQCRSPRILHLSTHGFFFDLRPEDPNRAAVRPGLLGGWFGEAGRLAGPLPENPMLRSGLALAGANTWLGGGTPPPEAEDGLLTAEDVAGLDLLATDLAVLSACDTGLGEVHHGEGVFGLQRAFVIAGAKTLVMSLWKVNDDATRLLMETFYALLTASKPRAEALHEAQQVVRKEHADPYYWGAFVCVGNPGPLPPGS